MLSLIAKDQSRLCCFGQKMIMVADTVSLNLQFTDVVGSAVI